MLTDLFKNKKNYVTPLGKKRGIWDRLSLGTSVYFGGRFLAQLYGNKKLAEQGKFDTQMWAHRSIEILQHLENCGGKFEIEGLEHINAVDGPVVFVSNHMSMLETMVFPGIIAPNREVTFVVKSSLTRHALFGPVMRARKPIAVDRKDPIADFKTVMTEGQKHIENGTSVVIFPQAQRMVEFIPEKFNTLGLKLAKKTKVPMIPVAIKTDFWSNGTLFKDIGKLNRSKKIHIKFGAPITIEGPGKKEQQQVVDFITNSLDGWKKE